MKAAAGASPDHVQARAVIIAALLFISYAYFYQGGGWNQNSRFDLTRAIVEQHTLRIDSYHENTEDKAHFAGHFYSDKAPGLSLSAVPAAALMKSLLQIMRVDSNSPRGVIAMSYVVTIVGASLPGAVAGACLFLLLLRLGVSESAAGFAAISLGLGTPMWAYASIFWGHALVGACLVAGLLFCVLLRERANPARDFWLGLAVGLAAGWATVSEYPAAPASAILAFLALRIVWGGGAPRIAPVAGGIAIGAGACLAVLMAFQYAAFGSPFQVGYIYEEAYPGMKHGFLGLGWPRVDRILKLLAGGRRGIFFHAPVLLAAPFGLRRMWQRPEQRMIAAVAATIALYYLLFNSSFYAWHGGSSYGPRYLSPALPLLCLGLAPVWDDFSRRLRILLTTLAAVSGFFTLSAVATTIQPAEGISYPLFRLCLPNFFAGRLSLNNASFLALSAGSSPHGYGAFNLGQVAGLHGLASLVPLCFIWGVAAWLWMRTESSESRAQPL